MVLCVISFQLCPQAAPDTASHMTLNIVSLGSPDAPRHSSSAGTGHEEDNTYTARVLSPSAIQRCAHSPPVSRIEAPRPDCRRCILSLRNFVQLQSHMAKQVTPWQTRVDDTWRLRSGRPTMRYSSRHLGFAAPDIASSTMLYHCIESISKT